MDEANKRELIIRFEGLSTDEANQAAAALEAHMSTVTGGGVETERRKASQDTQDAGTIVALILESATVVALATGIAQGLRDFIAMRGNRVVVETAEGRVVATGDAATNLDTAAVVSELSGY